MKMSFRPRGVCSRMINLDVEGGIIQSLEIVGGCPGNLEAICRLAKGRPAREVAGLLSGIHCGMKKTSCPDQVALALEKALQEG